MWYGLAEEFHKVKVEHPSDYGEDQQRGNNKFTMKW